MILKTVPHFFIPRGMVSYAHDVRALRVTSGAVEHKEGDWCHRGEKAQKAGISTDVGFQIYD